MIPFAKISEPELVAIARLPRRELLVWIALRLRARNGWAIKRRELEQLTGLGKRHVNLALRELERLGFVRCDFAGQKKDPWGRFRAATEIRGIPVEGSPGSLFSADQGSPGSLNTIQGSDQVDPVTDLSVRPDRARAHTREAEDGRTDERFARLEQIARELWPDVAKPGMFVARLLELAPFAPIEKLASYLRHGCATVKADIPLAVLCTRERWEASQQRRRRVRELERDNNAPSSSERLSPAELAELADSALKRRG